MDILLTYAFMGAFSWYLMDRIYTLVTLLYLISYLYQNRAFEIIFALGKGFLLGNSCSSQSILSKEKHCCSCEVVTTLDKCWEKNSNIEENNAINSGMLYITIPMRWPLTCHKQWWNYLYSMKFGQMVPSFPLPETQCQCHCCYCHLTGFYH